MKHSISVYVDAFQQQMEPGTEREIIIDMDPIIDAERGDERPAFYYAEESQQTQFVCERCGDFNDIRGLFGYCASCSYRNNMSMLRASYDKKRESLNANLVSPSDLVRSVVSEFDACCRNIAAQLAKRIPMKSGRRDLLDRAIFHDVDAQAFALLKGAFDIDILRGIDAADRSFVKMMQERRHIYEHNNGVVDSRYLELSGDMQWREGDLIRENQANVHRLIGLLNRMAENVQTDFHEIFALTEWPVKYHARRIKNARK